MNKTGENSYDCTVFNLSIASTCGSVGTSFPERREIGTEHALRASVRYDHVCAELKDSYRKAGNFLSVDCLYADVDNDDTRSTEKMEYWDNPDNQMSIKQFQEKYKAYEHIIYTSRNHQREKSVTVKSDGSEITIKRPARDKFHVLFPLGRSITDVNELKALLRALTEAYSCFDPAVKDPCRLLFGNPEAEVIWHPGASIEGHLREIIEKKQEVKQDAVKGSMVAVSKRSIAGESNGDFKWFDLEVVPQLDAMEIFSDVGDMRSVAGGQLQGCCPFHDDRNPSFSLNSETLTWICQSGCGKGNVFEYVSKLHDVSKMEAIDRLCEIAGVENRFRSGRSRRVVDVFPDAPVPKDLMIPSTYKLGNMGINLVVTKGDDQVEVNIAPNPVLISGRMIRDEGKEEDIKLCWLRDGNWKHHEVERDVIAEGRKLVELSRYGFPVTSNSATQLVSYLEAFESENIRKLPTSKSSRRLGWQNKEQGFLLGSSYLTVEDGKAIEIDTADTDPREISREWVKFLPSDEGAKQIASAYRKSGSMEEWVKLVNQLFDCHRVIAGIYFSLLPPFLNILGSPNFTVDWACGTSKGKTTTLRLAGSVWGCPVENEGHSIFHSWDVTQVWIETTASLLNGLPLLLDDTKLAGAGRNAEKASEMISRTIYAISTGQGRGRGSIGGTRVSGHFRTILLSTGEQSAVDFTQDGGTRTRVIGLWGELFTDGDAASQGQLVNRINTTVKEHYGHAGPMVVKYLLEHKGNWSMWCEAYKQYGNYFASQAGNQSAGSRMANYLAALAVAIPVIHAAIPGLRRDKPVRDLIAHLQESTAAMVQESDRALEALKFAYGWAVSHKDTFWRKNDDGLPLRAPYAGWSGRWDVNGQWKYLAFFTYKLSDLLKDEGYDAIAIIKTWRDRDWLDTGSDQIGKSVRIDGPSGFCYCIRREILESKLEIVFDSEESVTGSRSLYDGA